ncbi:hypothetical protein EW026_g6053 [Hermanssonia centrifuga]|uniref:Uncharacterized protein n=1 Tax=Hermanssonia centrifuga TaxID=98765 RepID=A0A4S4KGL8_9APHY|nr:hypothetical protein EW026_g6053 [Hermanssonia centrifuga]
MTLSVLSSTLGIPLNTKGVKSLAVQPWMHIYPVRLYWANPLDVQARSLAFAAAVTSPVLQAYVEIALTNAQTKYAPYPVHISLGSHHRHPGLDSQDLLKHELHIISKRIRGITDDAVRHLLMDRMEECRIYVHARATNGAGVSPTSVSRE